MEALVVVAHDDDAVLWMAGTILRLNDWNWHIISVCNQNNEIRKNYFVRTCQELKARPDALDFHDYQAVNSADMRNSIPKMKQALIQVAGAKEYDYVFTHSRSRHGEYGHHANHEEVCTAVRELVSENSLVTKRSRLVYFSYSPIYGLSGLGTVARQDANFYMQLRYRDLISKTELICSHIKPVVENLECDLGAPCPNPEAFEGDDVNLPTPFIRR